MRFTAANDLPAALSFNIMRLQYGSNRELSLGKRTLICLVTLHDVPVLIFISRHFSEEPRTQFIPTFRQSGILQKSVLKFISDIFFERSTMFN